MSKENTIFPESLPNRTLTPQGFIALLKESNVPLTDDQRSIRAATDLLDNSPFPSILNHLASGFRYINQDEFTRDIYTLSRYVNRRYNNTPYITEVTTGQCRSMKWVYEALVSKGMQRAKHVLSSSYGFEPSDHAYSTTLDDLQINTIIFFDDWALSGGEIQDQFLAEARHDLRNCQLPVTIDVATLYITQAAQTLLRSKADNIITSSQKPILQLEDVLTEDQYEWLEYLSVSEIGKDYGRFDPNTCTLTCGWWSIPDNFPNIFYNPQSKYCLVDEKKIQTPYR